MCNTWPLSCAGVLWGCTVHNIQTFVFVFWGWSTITATYTPRAMSEQEMDFLILCGSFGACTVTGCLLAGGLYSSTWKTKALFDPSSFGIQIGAQLINSWVGNLSYFQLARAGADAGALVPLSMLFPIVGVVVDLSRGEPISSLTGVGIAIVAISGVCLSREMLATNSKATPNPKAIDSAAIVGNGDNAEDDRDNVLLDPQPTSQRRACTTIMV